MFCRKCGKELSDNAKFCNRCGTPVIKDNKKVVIASLVSSICGLGFNVIFDPLLGYVYKRFILQIGEVSANLILAWTSGVTLFNAVVCVFVATILYVALRKPFARFKI